MTTTAILRLSIYVIVFMVINGAVLGKSEKSVKEDDQCQLPDANDYLFIYTWSRGWAYAGVNPNPNYLCFVNVSGGMDIRYRPSRAYNVTDNEEVELNGCVFWVCSDPALRQRIADASLCNGQPTGAQQIVDRLMIFLNQPGWLYVAIYDGTLSLDYQRDNNYCWLSFNMDGVDWYVVAVKLEVAAG